MATIQLGALTPTQGFTLFGADAGDESGFAVGRAGDVNRDGFDDWIIGAPKANGSGNGTSDAGESYLIFGSPTSPTTIDLANVGTTVPGTKFFGINVDDLSGVSVNQAGDINGDGFQDLLIGAYNGNAANNAKADAGETYLIFGSNNLAASINLSTIGTTTAGVTFFGADIDDYSGNSVSMAGDINGDGFDDLIIGAYKADGSGNAKQSSGESYLVFGATTLPSTIELNSIGLTTAGAKFFGADAYDFSGRSVNAAGDFNGDGFDDLVIGAPYADGTANSELDAGDCYLIFGGPTIQATIDLATIGTTTPGVLFNGSRTEDYSGRSVSGAGDVNGDGFDDLLIGAHFGDAASNSKFNAGDSFLIFGRAASPASVDLANTGGSVPGIKLYGTDSLDQSGFAVSFAGDINGDGFDDLLIGAYVADGSGNTKLHSGESYVVFGAATMPVAIDQTNVGTSIPGIVLYGVDADDFSGRSISGLGDVNGDGFADFLIGASRADGAGNGKFYAGESYLIYGSDFTSSVTHPGTAASETISGTSIANIIVGGRGNDTLIGNGAADVMYGGQGDDILAISDLLFKRIVGGLGNDTLRLDGAGLSIDLSTIANNRILGVEQIDITGSGNNTLSLSYREVLNISDESNMLIVRRNIGDVVQVGSGWTQLANETIGLNAFHVYSQGVARLKVQAVPQASIAGRQVFYNNALGFGTSGANNDPTVNPINAIDPTRMVLLPGATTSTFNYTNYSRGLNGIVVDLNNPGNLGAINASSFQFAAWSNFSNASPNFLTINPTVTVSTFPTGGMGSSARVKLAFPDRAIENAWLQITIIADANTGLASNDVFYFGNARSDVTPIASFPTQVAVNIFDVNQIRAQQGLNSGIVSNLFDVDRNGVVNIFDTNTTRAGQGIRSLRPFTAPSLLSLSRAFAPSISIKKSLRLSIIATDAIFAEFGNL